MDEDGPAHRWGKIRMHAGTDPCRWGQTHAGGDRALHGRGVDLHADGDRPARLGTDLDACGDRPIPSNFH